MKRRGILRNPLRTYSFKDKDPVIDVLRTLFQIEASLRRVSIGKIITEVSEGTGISVGCFKQWFYGGTVSPRFSYVQAVAVWFEAPVTLAGATVGKSWKRDHKPRQLGAGATRH